MMNNMAKSSKEENQLLGCGLGIGFMIFLGWLTFWGSVIFLMIAAGYKLIHGW